MTYNTLIDRTLELVPKLKSSPAYYPENLLPDDHIIEIPIITPFTEAKLLVYYISHPYFDPDRGIVFNPSLDTNNKIDFIPSTPKARFEHFLKETILNRIEKDEKSLLLQITELSRGIFRKYDDIDIEASNRLGISKQLSLLIPINNNINTLDIPIIIRKSPLTHNDIENVRKDILLLAAIDIVLKGV